MMPSGDGGIPTTDLAMPAMSDLVAFYRHVMRRCDQADQWQREGRYQWAVEELDHLGYRLTRCASEVPDDMRARAISEAMSDRIADGFNGSGPEQ